MHCNLLDSCGGPQTTGRFGLGFAALFVCSRSMEININGFLRPFHSTSSLPVPPKLPSPRASSSWNSCGSSALMRAKGLLVVCHTSRSLHDPKSSPDGVLQGVRPVESKSSLCSVPVWQNRRSEITARLSVQGASREAEHSLIFLFAALLRMLD